MWKGRFVNLDSVYTEKTLDHFKRWRQERARKLREKDYSLIVPNVAPDLTYLHHNCGESAITWIGHSTFLIQHSGLNIVTDPVWTMQLGIGKRMTPPGVPIGEMPPVDVVLVSHSHYDHLSITSLRRLQGAKTLLVPAGLKQKLQLKGFMRVKELHWWESVTIRGVRFTFVPSQHWSRRTPWDTNRSHWGGWVIQPAAAEPDSPERAAPAGEHAGEHAGVPGGTPAAADAPPLAGGAADAASARSAQRAAGCAAMLAHAAEFAADGPLPARAAAPAGSYAPARPTMPQAPTIYFAGDSGYFRGFCDIGSRFAIDVAMLPIGAYEPEWFMGAQHVNPEEALQAFLDTRAQWFVPMHYGSFKLADDTPKEALDRLEAGRERLGIDPGRLVILPHGETWRLGPPV